eukprot:TRINITY_DN20809_c0_g1_i1.p1 TRINITY_DN20809_c0_g1~~TRINITY_DN20809_c0_g1_i1.p1  ORF type:complete len:612 (+),score=120.43 TRINITY_DN20809_c0_g1_i1:185-1837(+)
MATRMYLHGGCDEKQAYSDLHLLEIEQMKWTQLQTEGSAPAARWGHTVEGYDTELIVFGGIAAEEAALLSDAGSSAPVAPPFMAGSSWAHGGAPTNSLYKLQTQTLKWEATSCVGTPPSPRCFHSALVVNDLYVVFGGSATSDYSQPLDDIHWLDLRSMQWTSPSVSGTPPPARFGQKMINGPDDQILVFGGSTSPSGSPAQAGVLHCFKISTATWSTVQVQGTPPLERSFHTFDLIGKWGFCFAGTSGGNSVSDLYILDVPNMRWARPLYEGQVNVRAHASSVLHDKLIVFGGVRDKVTQTSRTGAPTVEPHISKKLFFLNVLEVKGGVAEGDFKFKLVTVGDSGVGKSCLLTRFVQDYYSDFHVSTIGVDFKTVVTMVKGRLVKLQLWDTAGQERFSVVTGNYYRNSDGFIFVYDATSRASFDHVEQWLGQVQQHHECGPTTIKILVGNKCDMINELQVTEEEGRAKAEQMGAFFIATSAKTAANVDMAFLTAAQNLVETRRKLRAQPKAAAQGSSGQGGGLSLGSSAAQGGAGAKKANCCAGGGLKR